MKQVTMVEHHQHQYGPWRENLGPGGFRNGPTKLISIKKKHLLVKIRQTTH